ncbi:hypothetical protein HHI36_001297 [Cryptolaemus montrouzieri]|uniref:Uncharacterized protein n=1 Tax=Cryptolaemus montrouzieri TaxID=559131 RepID=A0ABD2P6Z9_9CUCU
MPSFLGEISTLPHLIAALTVCETHGNPIREKALIIPRSEPTWNSLEGKIKDIRKKTNPSAKLLKSARKVPSEFNIKAKLPDFRERIVVICDLMDKKVKTLGNRARRYNERVKRFGNNGLFYTNQKQFFQSLEEQPESNEKTADP